MRKIWNKVILKSQEIQMLKINMITKNLN